MSPTQSVPQLFTNFLWDFESWLTLHQNPGQNTYPSSVGFMSNSIDSLELLMRAILSTKPWLRDPEVMPMPWREEVIEATLARATSTGASNESRPLKIGIYWTDGVVNPQPPIERGLRLLAATLKKAGHRLGSFAYYK